MQKKESQLHSRGGWERLCITFRLNNSLFTHIILIHPAGKCSGQHLLSPGERVSEIIKCTQSNLLYFLSHRGKKKLLWTEECRLGSCPITSHAVFLTNTTVAGHTHTHTHKASYFSLISMPTFSSFVDHQHQKNVFKRMINPGISPATQWLRLHASAAVIVGSILDQGTMIQHATGRGQKFKKKKR